MSSVVSLDDRSFATGARTSTTTSSFSFSRKSDTVSECTMDRTQSLEEVEVKIRTAAVSNTNPVKRRAVSPLKISYEKPRVCSIHYKTVSHMLATCLLVPLSIETLWVFTSPSHPKNYNVIVGILNSSALFLSVLHVPIFLLTRSPTLKSAVFTFWTGMLIVFVLAGAGCYVWITVHFGQQLVVPFHYISFFGSVVSVIFGAIAVYIEHQASQYAIIY
ncbi:unnamed protein product [Caenorhabditis sp. 36 PRJEB53466]|nr:unnamed protein product [Caenorhabditis sp. 36 PRJEB53466]